MTKKIGQFLRHLINRRVNISLFISVQVLSPTNFVLVDELAESRLSGFALAFDRLAKSLAFNLTQNLRTASQRFPARCRLGPCCSSS